MMTTLFVITLVIVLSGLMWTNLGWLVSWSLTFMVFMGGMCDMIVSLVAWLFKKVRML